MLLAPCGWGIRSGDTVESRIGGDNGRARIAVPYLAYCLDYPPHCTLFTLCENTYAPSEKIIWTRAQ